MPAFYWSRLYIDTEDIGIIQLIDNTMNSLIKSDCHFKGVSISQAEDESVRPQNQKFIVEWMSLSVKEARILAIRDLDDWISGFHVGKWTPGVQLVFEYDFKFDDVLKVRGRDKDIKDVNEVKLSFWYLKDKRFKNKIVIDIATCEEYVLMYGKKETHQHNKKNILGMIENIYINTGPYFGWMDGEANSKDNSFNLLLKGKVPVGNEFVIIGKKMIKKLNKRKLEKSKHYWKILPDGGIIIQNFKEGNKNLLEE